MVMAMVPSMIASMTKCMSECTRARRNSARPASWIENHEDPDIDGDIRIPYCQHHLTQVMGMLQTASQGQSLAALHAITHRLDEETAKDPGGLVYIRILKQNPKSLLSIL